MDPSQMTMVPQPDPTVLTTAQLTREIANARELIESKVSGSTALLAARIDAHDREASHDRLITDRHIDAAVAGVKDLIETRLLALDKAIVLTEEQGRKWIEKLQLLLEEQIHSSESKTETLDRVVQTRLAGSETALTAAMTAADKVTQEIKTNFGAVMNETKAGMTKQIDTLKESIDDLKGRLDRGEGVSRGAVDTSANQRDITRNVIAFGSLVIAIIAVIIATVVAITSHGQI